MSRRADADRLAALLEGSAEPDGGEERQLTALATLLRDTTPAPPPMRAAFRTELRAQVVESARTQAAEAPLLTRLRDRVQRARYSAGLAGATGVASMALAGGGVAGAAEQAQPGDLLYGTKLAIEDARLFLTGDDAARGERAISYALDRLAEAQQAADDGDVEGAATALDGAAERTREGTAAILGSGDDAPLLDLADALDREESALEALLPALDGPSIVAAEAVLAEIVAARDAIAAALTLPGLPGNGQGLPDAIMPGLATPAATPTPTPVPTPTATPSTDPTDEPADDLPSGTDGSLPDLPVPLPDLPDLGDPLPDLPVPLPDLEEPLEETGEVIEDTLDGTGEVLEEALDGTGDVVEDAVDGVGDVLESTLGTPGEALDDTLDATGALVDDLVDGIGGAVGGLLGGAGSDR